MERGVRRPLNLILRNRPPSVSPSRIRPLHMFQILLRSPARPSTRNRRWSRWIRTMLTNNRNWERLLVQARTRGVEKTLVLKTPTSRPKSLSSRGEVGGGQSSNGGVHSVANETLLPSRAHTSTSSSVLASTYRDSTLDRLSRAQFRDPQSQGSSRASASATRAIDSLQSTRAAFFGVSRDASFNISRGTAYQDFGDPNLASSPRRPFEDFFRDPLRLDRGLLPCMRTYYGKSFQQSTCQAYWSEVCFLCRLLGPFCQTNLRITGQWPWPWTTIFSRSCSMPSRHQNLILDWSNRILPSAFHKLCT